MKKVNKIKYTRVTDRKARTISFLNRTYIQIQQAWEKLKQRYKSVKLGRLRSQGASLYTGSFIVA